MAKPVRILMLEDMEVDAELIEFELQEAGFNYTLKRAMTEKDFLRELADFSPDVILSDYDLPMYNGAKALTAAKTRCPEVPFILVTGAISEDLAIDIFTNGAKDYVMKTRLHRLVPAVKRAIEEVAEIKARKTAERKLQDSHKNLQILVAERTAQLQKELEERRQAEEALHKSKKQIQTILESITEIYMSFDRDLCVKEINHAGERALGKGRNELVGKKFLKVFPRSGGSEIYQQYENAIGSGIPVHFEALSAINDRWYELHAYPSEQGLSVYYHDITKRKHAEDDVLRAKDYWERTFDATPDLIAIIDTEFHIVQANKAMAKRLGLTPQSCIGQICYKAIHGTAEPPAFCPHRQTITDKLEHTADVHEERLAGDFIVSTSPLFEPDGRMTGSVHVARDITARKRAEEALRKSEDRLKRSQEMAHLGIWELDLVQNRLTWSDEVYRIFGLQPGQFGATYEAFLERVHPDDRATVDAAYSRSLREKIGAYEIEHRVVRKDTGEIRLVREKCEHIRDTAGKIFRSIGMVHDVTDRKIREADHSPV
jgi:PAS domain S-box-containing protein